MFSGQRLMTVIALSALVASAVAVAAHENTDQRPVIDLEASLAKSRNEIQNLKADVDGLREQLKAKEIENSAISKAAQDSMASSNSDISKLQADLANVRQELEEVKTQREILLKATYKTETGQNTELLRRVEQLEQAWLPKWADDLIMDTQVKLQSVHVWAIAEGHKIFSQGKSAAEKAADSASRFVKELRSSPEVQKLQDNAARAWISLAGFTTQAMDDIKPRIESARQYINMLHKELEGFLSMKLGEIPELAHYSKPEFVSVLVSAMIFSPLVAFMFPILICMCSSRDKETRNGLRMKSNKLGSDSSKPSHSAAQGRSNQNMHGGITGINSRTGKKSTAKNPSPANKNKSPVLHGHEAYVDSGGQRVKYGKAVPMRV